MIKYLVLSIVFGYLLGSIPFGWLLTKLAGLGDIRSIGSGNIGATNVLRTGRKGLAALTLFLDGAKGFAAVMLAAAFLPGTEELAGLAALLGHMFPIWLKGKGGKGVATAIGIIMALSWQAAVLIMLTWVAVAIITRYSSLAAIVAIGLAPFFVFVLRRPDMLWLTIVVAILVIIRHGENIKRLRHKEESKIGKK